MTPPSDDRPWARRVVHRLPPRGYRSETAARWFPRTAEEIRWSLGHFGPFAAAGDPDTPPVMVVVMPWFRTPAPWYSLFLAAGLARRGRRVLLCVDDLDQVQEDLAGQQRAIDRVVDALADTVPIVRCSDAGPAPGRPGDDALVADLARQNATWNLRGVTTGAHFDRVASEHRAALAAALPRIRATVDRIRPAAALVPGGVCNDSGLFVAVGRELGIRSATFDADRGVAQICVDGVAAQGGDVARAFRAVWEEGPRARAEEAETARAELEARASTTDRYGFQVTARSDARTEPIAALIPMNVEWDSAALGRHLHFRDSAEWIGETVATVLAEDVGTVVVRQHPSERRASQRSRFDVAALLRDRFGDDDRVRFVAADDPTSTYDLVQAAGLVLPFVSTIAVEAAAAGAPVVIAGRCYFEDLGFVHTAASRPEYLQLVRDGLHGRLPNLPDQQDRAWTCLALTAVHNRVHTDFTAQPDDFWSWCGVSPDHLFDRPEIADILEAVDTDVPLSLIRRARLRGTR